MANSSMPDWLTADKLLWRPTTVEYPLAWDDVLVFKGNSWLDTYEEGGFNLVRKNTDLLVPIVKRTMGRKGFDKLREVESKRGWDGVTQWIGDVYRAAAYGHLAHFRSLAAAERDRPRNINSVFKRVFEMDKAEKGQLIDLWHESLNWEFSNWHHRISDGAGTGVIPHQFDYEFLRDLVAGYDSIGFGPEEGLSVHTEVKSLLDLLLRAWLDSRSKFLDFQMFNTFFDRVEMVYFDGVLEPRDSY